VDYDWSEIGKFLSYLAPVIIFLLFNVFFRKQREQQGRLAVVKSLLSEIDYNHRLVESFSLQPQMKKFKAATWKRNKEKMDYIDPNILSILANAYEITDGFNREIDKTKKYKSTSYLVGINAERLTEPLAKSRQGLEEWIVLNKGKKKITSG